MDGEMDPSVLSYGYVGLRIASKSRRTGVPPALTVTPYRSTGRSARIRFSADPLGELDPE